MQRRTAAAHDDPQARALAVMSGWHAGCVRSGIHIPFIAMHSARIHIGISGWRYAGWRGAFYPKGLRQADELKAASQAVGTIEINGTHYSLQTPERFEHWREQTPPAFIFSVKGSRYVTHMLRGKGDKTRTALANFFAQGVLALRDKLGPVLWQFPPSYRFDPDAFAHFLEMLPRTTADAQALAAHHDDRIASPYLKRGRNRRIRYAIEVRHDSFRDAAFIRLLRRHGAALVVSDTTEPWLYAEDLTADFVYLRLHGATGKYKGAYSDAALDRWASRIGLWAAGKQPQDAELIAPGLSRPRRAGRQVFCYFDNDIKSQAPFDAQRLMASLGLKGG